MMFSLAGALLGLGAVFTSFGFISTVLLMLYTVTGGFDEYGTEFRPSMLVFPVMLLIGAFLVGGLG